MNKLVPGRLAGFAALAVVLTAVGLVTGCSSASKSTAVAATASSSPVSSAPASSAAPVSSAPASAPASGPASSSPAPADTAGNGTKVGTYSFNLTSGYSAPLGATAPTQAEMAANGSCDVSYNSDIYSCNQEKVISLPSGSTPTYSACTSGTIFAAGISPTQGNVFCIVETRGEMAAVTVAAAGNSPSQYVSLKVTVWKYIS